MTEQHELTIDGTALLRQLRELAQIGDGGADAGRTRLAASDADRLGRDRLVAWMRDLDLTVQIDAIGNIFGSMAGHDVTAAPLMIGSHIDTVVQAGAYDGTLGVLAGLATVRAYRAAGRIPPRNLVVAAFTNEEGVRYQPDMLGSLVTVGGIELEEALDIVGMDGTRLGDELQRIGYAGSMRPGTLRPAAYLELHIEQGPLLEETAILIGAVENLQGISWQQIVIDGTANHAGTTPTRLRHDAGYAAGALIAEVRRIAQQSATTLATVGSLRFEPDVINVIPRRATLTLDLRDPDEQRLQAAEQVTAEFLAEIAAREGLTITTTRLARFAPVVFDAALVAQIAAAAQQRGLSVSRMTSGAGHDAQMMARIAPSAMIFIPSRAGISHNPAEFSSDEQVLAGAQVLADVVGRWMADTELR